ncbi:hypothetical protein AB835_08970 [Candidatus Endobugula sertula]|uniref:DUF58 domain-containing protein n=1 Tax=Candidatus Endobugula sertula TaxID=62101 RepID=A0A1D2QP93_9GAMM|nr:hypothetical protein AB835_08970 [Candidatus Endobugula sertula]
MSKQVPKHTPYANTLFPKGAYVELNELQQLRYLAQQCVSPKNRVNKANLGGQYKSRAINRGMEFEEVRVYQPGDDIRSIDWRVTARTQVTHSKRYSEEKEHPIITAVDQRRSLFFGSHPCFKSVYACHIAAIINWVTLANDDRCGGLVLSQNGMSETRPVRSHKTVNRWLQQLTTANQQLSTEIRTEPHFVDLLQQLQQTTQAGSSIYIISDFYDLDKECEPWLFRLARHNQITLLWVVDTLEAHIPNTASLAISNGKASQQMSIQQQTQHAFHQQFKNKEQRLIHLQQQYKLRLQLAFVQTPPLDIVKECFI